MATSTTPTLIPNVRRNERRDDTFRLGVARDQIREHSSLEELQHFFDLTLIGHELHEQVHPQALLLGIEGFGPRGAAPGPPREIHDEEQDAPRLR